MELGYPEGDEVASMTPEDSLPGVSEDEYEQDRENRIVLRTSSRRKVSLTLPFSPKKTRSRKVNTLPDGDEDEDANSEIEDIQPRRSTRTRMPTKASLANEDYHMSSGSEDSDGFLLKPQGKPKKQAKRERKAAPPAYGYVRDVSELDYDSDEDTAPLRAHKNACERCKSLPAHIALEKLRKAQTSKRKKKEKKNDDDEEEEDEEERLMELGGWIRWSVGMLNLHAAFNDKSLFV